MPPAIKKIMIDFILGCKEDVAALIYCCPMIKTPSYKSED